MSTLTPTILFNSLQTGFPPHHSSDSGSSKVTDQKSKDTALDTVDFVFSFFYSFAFHDISPSGLYIPPQYFTSALFTEITSSAYILGIPWGFVPRLQLLSSLSLFLEGVSHASIFNRTSYMPRTNKSLWLAWIALLST